MEPYSDQQPAAVGRAKTSAKGTLVLPILSLVCGVSAYLVGWLAYASLFMRPDVPFIGDALQSLSPSLPSLWMLRGTAALLALLAVVLGVIGLIICVRRLARAVRRAKMIAGIVMSAVGLLAGMIACYEVLMSIALYGQMA